MAWFGRLGIRTKLYLGFGAVLAITGSAAAINFVAVSQQTSTSDRVVTHLEPAKAAARDIVTWVRSADDDGAWYVMATDPA